jgi:hypothetical protein
VYSKCTAPSLPEVHYGTTERRISLRLHYIFSKNEIHYIFDKTRLNEIFDKIRKLLKVIIKESYSSPEIVTRLPLLSMAWL